MDADVAGDEHKSADLPPVRESDLAFLNAMELPSTTAVDPGHKLQPWWPFENFLEFTTYNIRWNVDAIPDLARIMRISGTIDHKGASVPVTIYSNDWLRYKPSQFKQFMVKPKPMS